MTSRYILAIDQGTTSSRALIVRFEITAKRKGASIIGKGTKEFQQYFPSPGFVEHNLDEIWDSVKKSVKVAVTEAKKCDKHFNVKKISSIGITNQRETLCVFDPVSSKPLRKAIVWQCKRSKDICTNLKKKGLEKEIKAKTGLVLDPYFSGSKITWIIENDLKIKRLLQNRKALLGTIDSFLIYKLTNGKSHVTEASNASRTLLFNIKTGAWDKDLLKIFKVPHIDNLPTVKDSADQFGVTKRLGFLPDGIPITGVLGDQQAALAGQKCYKQGEAKCTYGTGAFLLLNCGSKAIRSRHGLITTVAWSLKGKLTYALEGSSFIAGAAVQFLRDNLSLIKSASETERLAKNAKASPRMFFVPSLTGLGVPYWDPHAEGAFLGLNRGTTKQEIIRATLEGICFQVNDLINSIKEEINMKKLHVDGGATINNVLMSIQANISHINIIRPKNLETTAFGAALFSALGHGLFHSLEEMKSIADQEHIFKPDNKKGAQAVRIRNLAAWKRAIRAVRTFAGTEK